MYCNNNFNGKYWGKFRPKLSGPSGIRISGLRTTGFRISGIKLPGSRLAGSGLAGSGLPGSGLAGSGLPKTRCIKVTTFRPRLDKTACFNCLNVKLASKRWENGSNAFITCGSLAILVSDHMYDVTTRRVRVTAVAKSDFTEICPA